MGRNITLAMGNGGEENYLLLQKIFKHLKNEYLEKAEDGTPLPPLTTPIFTTDSFTISPLFFKGGDIGKLAVAGATNDLAMMGAEPKFLSLSFLIEEGFGLRDFEKVLKSIKKECEINGAKVVTGDTKVLPQGSCDKLFINVSAVGERVKNYSQENIQEGDLILVSGDIGRHGSAIFIAREGIELESELESDCKSLFPIVKELFEIEGVKALRDATRGGVSAVLNEWAKEREVCIELEESKIPISDEVRGVCEILGFEPLILANEGTFLAAVSPESAPRVLEVLQKFNPNAQIIGEVTKSYPRRVVLISEWGTRRFLDMPTGEILPRIC
ncbi:MAG: hydrogenase expression/formation protein HypE [Epsilonproteobacteria bacterium]|nr:hydrogenase expression/formation protein HypE [Campylobacterota bacterium]